ncbi:type III-A CRISPR-associated protein Cas10/Csm1 [Carboxydocella sp. JDF658]|uniref:type III-A CRISPR-associated protein Cas10/Csm1 n=1 Tax=Carboxydocella sp. JDF658 TaxID=1926600 RepID=UPI0009AEB9A3|nr:type III-A CRISPR-associated protein Cas10/Csm1 [Carboxydocella sp. JDF658]GAW32210.1 type III-A CRISPR-associated protein Cas10/Csm1 [Carboxydocella sp. JDF658]
MNELMFQTVTLAALVHDIGKFIQRADFGEQQLRKTHQEHSLMWASKLAQYLEGQVDPWLWQELVLKHHDNRQTPEQYRPASIDERFRPLGYLVSKADNLSSSERGDTVAKDFRTQPLASVFSAIQVEGKKADRLTWYEVAPLAPAAVKPVPETRIDRNRLANMVAEFSSQCAEICQQPGLDFAAFFTQLQFLLQRYTWCIPANTQEEIPDISLYDHLRTSAAIAACMYRFHEEGGSWDTGQINREQRHCLHLIADLSGIQDYILGVNRIGIKGVAKSLRARSFRLAVMADALALKLVQLAGVTPANILQVSGGTVHLLLPNTRAVKAALSDFRQELDRWSLREFQGLLRWNLAWTEVEDGEFKDYSLVYRRVFQQLGQQKLRPLAGGLQRDNGWKEEAFLGLLPERAPCKVCGMRAHIDEKDTCIDCQRLESVGSDLPSARSLLLYNEPAANRIELAPGLYGELGNKGDGRELATFVLGLDRLYQATSGYIFYKGLGNYAARVEKDCELQDDCGDCRWQEGDILPLDCLARLADGKEMIAYLKGDVDNLGYIFSRGLGERISISRLATLSRMLDYFFSAWLKDFLATNYPYSYVVYSGGDDFLLLCPWSESLGLVSDLRRAFADYTGRNPALTFSVGLSLTKPQLPLARGVARAEHQLELAKDSGKDRLGLLERALTWPQLDRVWDEAAQVGNWLLDKQTGLSTNFLRYLLQFAGMYRHYRQTGDPLGLKFVPLLYYQVVRNLSGKADPEVKKWALGLIQQGQGQGIYPAMEDIEVVVRLAYLYTRR